MLTPWGKATRVIHLERGISFVVTPEHGGLVLAREYAEARLSLPARKRGRCLGDTYAFEMESAWALVLWEIPHLRVAWVGAGAPEADHFAERTLSAIISKRFPDYLKEYWALKSYTMCRP
jgi:hypothetical protein